ncbi:MAG: stage V sporulation protein AD, partial [Oscillospiraceae bacterium]|nr:stage V sporulation protein AD [Oscillospiraceae bacterium]
MKKLGPYTIKLDKCPQILGYASAAGKKEGQGPLQNRFDIIFTDPYIGAESFEKAESLMQNKVAQKALTKAGISAADIDFIFAGDLLNQCAGSHYGMRGMDAAFIGLYGACSTMAQSLALASLFVEAGFAGKTLAVTSSHYCASERQFRFPLEYGGQRPPTSQCTVTGAGAVIVSDIPFTEDVSPVSGKSTPYVKGVTFGKIVDLGITDQNNMGAAMAPAA